MDGTFLLFINQKIILVDPVLSGSASPIGGKMKAFEGSDQYTFDDIPKVDYLLITHDHYDHLDYNTIKRLKEKINHFIIPLGVGAHLEKWGLENKILLEGEWGDSMMLANDIKIHFTPA